MVTSEIDISPVLELAETAPFKQRRHRQAERQKHLGNWPHGQGEIPQMADSKSCFVWYYLLVVPRLTRW